MTRSIFISFAVLLTALLAGASCSDETAMPAPATSDAGDGDGGVSTADSASPASDDGGDAGTDTGANGGDAGVGETCAGYGAGETCETEQGKPYGYVCFGGAPPGVAGCKLTRESASIGNNYCCSENVCVEQIDQSAACNAVTGKPRRVQCPPTDTGYAAPPADCVEHNSGSSDVEKYYCCP